MCVQGGALLSSEELFEDIMQDYANRTVTIESHPHTGVPQASIHPCQVRTVPVSSLFLT